MKTFVLDANVCLRFLLADFPDCYAAAEGARRGISVATYDKDFKKFPDSTAQTPDEILRGNVRPPAADT